MSKKYSGIYLDKKTNKYYVSTTFITRDGFEVKKCKRGFDTQRDADLWKQEQKLFYSKVDLTSLENRKTPLEEMLIKYCKAERIRLKPTTIANKKTILENHFIPYFKTKILNEVSPAQIQEFYENLCKKSLKTSSINATIDIITCFLDWLDLMEFIDGSTNKKFKRILLRQEKQEETSNGFLSQEELKRLMQSLDTSTYSGKEKRLFYSLCAYAGLRCGEALGLFYSDIDFNNNTIKVDKQEQFVNGKIVIVNYTKTNQIKIVDVPQDLIDYILEFKQINGCGDDDRILNKSRTYYRESLNKDLKKVNLKHIRIHDLRHSYCTMLYDMGADEKYVAKQMGHTSSTTSKNVYEHLTNKKNEKNKVEVITKLME